MDYETITAIIAYLEEQLRLVNVHSKQIVLFGSQSRSDAHDDSDIDIAIISDDFAGKTIFERVRMIQNAEVNTIRKFMVPLDIVLLSSQEFEEERFLISSFAKQGKVLFHA